MPRSRPFRRSRRSVTRRPRLALEVLEARITPSILISDNSPGYYADLGDLINGPDQVFTTAPDVASDPSLGTWLVAVPPTRGNWSSAPIPTIPTGWPVSGGAGQGLEESAVVYPFVLEQRTVNINLKFGADNGAFVWLDGVYLTGGINEGGASADEYQVPSFTLEKGTHYLQVLRENHGGPSDFTISMTTPDATNGVYQRLNDQAVAFRDVDGDTAVVAANAPLFTSAEAIDGYLHFAPSGSGRQLQQVSLGDAGAGVDLRVYAATDDNLSLNADLFGDPNLIAFVKQVRDTNPPDAGADGRVNVGAITSNKNLLQVSVAGDLGRIEAGDPNDGSTVALSSLKLGSLGYHGSVTQGPGGSVDSVLHGSLISLYVAGSFDGHLIVARRDIPGAADPGGNLLAGLIGKDILGGRLSTDGDLGSLEVLGGIIGLDPANSGQVDCRGNLVGTLHVTGNVEGGLGDGSGQVRVARQADSIVVDGSVLGGPGTWSGYVTNYWSAGGANVAREVRISGNVVGGPGGGSGGLLFGAVTSRLTIAGGLAGGGGRTSGKVLVQRDVNNVRMGPISGGNGKESGVFLALGRVASATIGVVRGSRGDASGMFQVLGTAQNIFVTGGITGGLGLYSGFLCLAAVKNVTVNGDVQGGAGPGSGRIDADTIDNLRVNGDVLGSAAKADYSGVVWARSGNIANATITGAIVGGRGVRSGVVSSSNIGRLVIGKGVYRPTYSGSGSGNVELKYVPTLTTKSAGTYQPKDNQNHTVTGSASAVTGRLTGGTILAKGGSGIVSRGGATLLSKGGGNLTPKGGTGMNNRTAAEQSTKNGGALVSRGGATIVSRGGGT